MTTKLGRVQQVAAEALRSWRLREAVFGADGPYPEWACVLLDLSNEVEVGSELLDGFVTGLIQDESVSLYWAARLRAALKG